MAHSRRGFLAGGFALVSAAALGRPARAHDAGLYESLRQAGRMDRPALAATQHVFDSPAPRAATPGRWMPRAPLLVPRSEMAWAAARAGRGAAAVAALGRGGRADGAPAPG